MLIPSVVVSGQNGPVHSVEGSVTKASVVVSGQKGPVHSVVGPVFILSVVVSGQNGPVQPVVVSTLISVVPPVASGKRIVQHLIIVMEKTASTCAHACICAKRCV